MDCSTEYIKMCDCDEVQGIWKPRDWDAVYIIVDKFWYDEDYVWRVLPKDIADGGFYGPYVKQDGSLDDRHERYIWLPRQGQIQEMLGDQTTTDGYVWTCLLLERYASGKLPSGNMPKCTWEQKWLSIYMQHKHKKIWDGERWVEGEK